MKGDRADHVGATDLTYVRLWQGLVSLGAMRDWYRRDVRSWEVSITWDSSGGGSARERALVRAQPAIFNSAQGAPCTSLAFTERWLERRILISMDGRGRAFDHIFVERWGRRVTDAEVY